MWLMVQHVQCDVAADVIEPRLESFYNLYLFIFFCAGTFFAMSFTCYIVIFSNGVWGDILTERKIYCSNL